MKRLLVILAKSTKNGNYCVAGIELATNKWIRPISHDADIQDAVPATALTYVDNTEAQIFDIVEIDFEDTPVANDIQPENLYYKDIAWKKYGHWNLAELERYCGFDSTDFIFYNTSRSLETSIIDSINRQKSLMILPIENIILKTEISHIDKIKKFHVDFNYNGERYERFGLGDIAIREEYANKPCGEYNIAENAAATFSLTNPYKDNRCYKMVANLFLGRNS